MRAVLDRHGAADLRSVAASRTPCPAPRLSRKGRIVSCSQAGRVVAAFSGRPAARPPAVTTRRSRSPLHQRRPGPPRAPSRADGRHIAAGRRLRSWPERPPRPTGRGEAYWRREAERLQDRLEPLAERAGRLRTRLAQLESGRPNAAPAMPRPAQLTGGVGSNGSAHAPPGGAFDDRARREGALPGWLREPGAIHRESAEAASRLSSSSASSVSSAVNSGAMLPA